MARASIYIQSDILYLLYLILWHNVSEQCLDKFCEII